MGCGSTSVAPAPQKPRKDNFNGTAPINTLTDTTTVPVPGGASLAEIMAAYEGIVTDACGFKLPPGCVAIACLNDDCIPLIAASLYLEGTSPTNVFLPVIAGVCSGDGCVMLFGHVSMLDRKYFESQDTALILLNSLSWLNRRKPMIDVLPFVGFPETRHSEIKHCLGPQGIRIVFCRLEDVDLERPHALILSSDVDMTDKPTRKKLRAFVEAGGGIGIFCVTRDRENVEMSINNFTTSYGLAFTHCSLSAEYATGTTVKVYPQYDSMKQYLFTSLVDQLSAHVAAKGSVSKLDDLVTAIRYYVLASKGQQEYLLWHILDLCWRYLKSTNYLMEDGSMCPELGQKVIIVLMLDIASKLPREKIRKHPNAESFPGISSVPKEDVTITLELKDESLISTGFWLNAGDVTSVECENPPPGLFIQIGAHTSSLLTKSGPWKRWPLVASAIPLESGKTVLASAFGGIVYVLAGSVPSGTKLNITLKDVSRYHVATFENDSIECNAESPWGEFVTKSVIFTMPTKDIQRIEAREHPYKFVERLVAIISRLMSYNVVRPYRVVFDVDLADETVTPDYPIVLQLADLDTLFFDHKRPSPGLFRFVSLLAIVSLRDGYFDADMEQALAAYIACLVMQEVFPSHEPSDYGMVVKPSLFSVVWYIHTKVNKNLLCEIIRRSQLPDAPVTDAPEDRWLRFVKDVCNLAHKDLTKLFQEAKPIPLSLTLSPCGP